MLRSSSSRRSAGNANSTRSPEPRSPEAGNAPRQHVAVDRLVALESYRRTNMGSDGTPGRDGSATKKDILENQQGMESSNRQLYQVQRLEGKLQ